MIFSANDQFRIGGISIRLSISPPVRSATCTACNCSNSASNALAGCCDASRSDSASNSQTYAARAKGRHVLPHDMLFNGSSITQSLDPSSQEAF